MARVDRVELNQYEFDLSDSIIIKCSCDGSPCPLNAPLQWYRDGKRLSDSSEIMNLNDRIHFMSYSKSMEGKYECRVGARSSPPAIVKTGCKLFPFFIFLLIHYVAEVDYTIIE